MKEYVKQTDIICGEKPVFYVIAEEKDFQKKNEKLDKNCICNVCQNYKKDYICHLLKAGEITGMKLLTFHNLHYFNTFVEEIRNKIKRGEI